MCVADGERQIIPGYGTLIGERSQTKDAQITAVSKTAETSSHYDMYCKISHRLQNKISASLSVH